MKFKIQREKFLEGLAAVSKAIADQHEHLTIYIADEAGKVESSAAFRHGLVAEYNKANDNECPLCGGRVYMHDNQFGDVAYICDRCRHEIPGEIYDGNAYVVSPSGVANFVKESIGGQYAQPCGGGNYRLGKVWGMKAFFCASPTEGFFNSHGENTLVIVCDISSVPHGWSSATCKAVSFEELFYLKNNGKDIRLAEDVVADIRPKAPSRRFGKHRLIHPRRDKWLQVIMNMLAAPFREKDFKDGMLTTAGAKYWFGKVHPEVRVCSRTFSRDIDELLHYDENKDAYDKRQPHIEKLLKLAADPNVPQSRRTEISKSISRELERAAQETRRNGGTMTELQDWGWIKGADGKSERVPTTSPDAIYDGVDRAMRKDKVAEEAAA